MKRKTLLILLIALLLAVPVAAPASAAISADTYDLSWYVLGGGGGAVSSGIYTLDGTIGQPVTGVVTASGYENCSGFWCGAINTLQNVFMPFLTKQ